MRDERASVLERLSTAMAAGGDADVVGALGMAQALAGATGAGGAPRDLASVASSRGEINAIGAHLTRLQAAASHLGYAQALASIRALVDRLNVARRWQLTEPQADRVAHNALLLHVSPACPACQGRRYELIPGTPHTSERHCQQCGGTGQRPYPRRNGEQVRAVLNVLGWIQGLMERAVTRRMA